MNSYTSSTSFESVWLQNDFWILIKLIDQPMSLYVGQETAHVRKRTLVFARQQPPIVDHGTNSAAVVMFQTFLLGQNWFRGCQCYQRGSLSSARINHRTSCRFRIFARSNNCPLCWKPIAGRIDSHAPLPAPDSNSDRVSNASMLHRTSLDPNAGSCCDRRHAMIKCEIVAMLVAQQGQ